MVTQCMYVGAFPNHVFVIYIYATYMKSYLEYNLYTWRTLVTFKTISGLDQLVGDPLVVWLYTALLAVIKGILCSVFLLLNYPRE